MVDPRPFARNCLFDGGSLKGAATGTVGPRSGNFGCPSCSTTETAGGGGTGFRHDLVSDVMDSMDLRYDKEYGSMPEAIIF